MEVFVTKIKVYRLHNEAGRIFPPVHTGDAGCDIEIPPRYANGIIRPSGFLVIDTGLALVPDEGYYVRIEPRSSRFKDGLLAHGIIDGGYRGEIKLVLWNLGKRNYHLKLGERVVQAIPTLYSEIKIDYNEGYPPEDTTRGRGSFGSTDT